MSRKTIKKYFIIILIYVSLFSLSLLLKFSRDSTVSKNGLEEQTGMIIAFQYSQPQCGNGIIEGVEVCDLPNWGICEVYEDCINCQCYDLRPDCTGCWYFDYCRNGMDPDTGQSCCVDMATQLTPADCCWDEINNKSELDCSQVNWKLNPNAISSYYYCYNNETDVTGSCVDIDYIAHEILQTC